MTPDACAAQAWTLLSPPPGTAGHWLALRAGRASGGIARGPDLLSRLLDSSETFSLHLGVNLTGANGRYRPTSRDITHLATVLCDIDPIDSDAHPFHFAEELTRHAEDLLGTRLHPYLIDSGRGAQLWFPCSATPFSSSADRIQWRLHVGLFLRSLAARAERNWGCCLDTSTADLPRVGRLIGSINHRTGRRARQLSAGIRSETMVDAIRQFASTASVDLVGHLSKGVGNTGRWQRAVDLIPFATARKFLTEGVSEPGRHSAAWHSARCLRELGVGQDAAIKAVRFGALLCRPRLSASDAERAARCAYSQEAMDGPQESNRFRGTPRTNPDLR